MDITAETQVLCILKNKNTYAIMPLGKEKQVVHIVRLQTKTPGWPSWGFLFPVYKMEGLESIGWLPTIYCRPTI